MTINSIAKIKRLHRSIKTLLQQNKDLTTVLSAKEAWISDSLKIADDLRRRLLIQSGRADETWAELKSAHEVIAAWAEREPRVFFICIGAQKAGTTWLHRYLWDHPQACVPWVKELHYFDAKLVSHLAPEAKFVSLAQERINLWKEEGFSAVPLEELECQQGRVSLGQSDRNYLLFLQSLCRPGHRAFGEVTPDYAMLDQAGFECIRAMRKDTRIIFIIRNPADRALSAFFYGGHVRTDEAPIRTFQRLLGSEYWKRISDYERTLTAAWATFGSEQVFVTYFENLFSDRGQTELKRLCDFIGIEALPADFDVKVNATPLHHIPEGMRTLAVEELHHVYKFAASKVGPLPESWSLDLTNS